MAEGLCWRHNHQREFNGSRAAALASDAKVAKRLRRSHLDRHEGGHVRLSNQLAALNANSTVAMSGSKAIFTAVAGADGRGCST